MAVTNQEANYVSRTDGWWRFVRETKIRLEVDFFFKKKYYLNKRFAVILETYLND